MKKNATKNLLLIMISNKLHWVIQASRHLFQWKSFILKTRQNLPRSQFSTKFTRLEHLISDIYFPFLDFEVIMYNGEPIWDEWRAPNKEKVYNLLLTDQCTVNLFNKKGKKVFSTNPDFKSKKKSIDNVSVDGSCKFGQPIFLESHQGTVNFSRVS